MPLSRGHIWCVLGVICTLLLPPTRQTVAQEPTSPAPVVSSPPAEEKQAEQETTPHPRGPGSWRLSLGGGDLRRGLLVEEGGSTLLINAGTADEAPRLLAHLQHARVTHLQRLVLTGADSLHLGGLATLLDHLSIGEIVDLSPPRATEIQLDTLRLIQRRGIPYTLGPEALRAGDLSVISHRMADNSDRRATDLLGVEISGGGVHLYIEPPTLGVDSPLPSALSSPMDLCILSPGRRTLNTWREIATRLGAQVALVQSSKLAPPRSRPTSPEIWPLRPGEILEIQPGPPPTRWQAKTPTFNWPALGEPANTAENEKGTSKEALPRTPETSPPTTPVTLVASAESKVYHRASCPNSRRISPSHKVGYHTAAEAELDHKTPARCCFTSRTGGSEARGDSQASREDQSSTR